MQNWKYKPNCFVLFSSSQQHFLQKDPTHWSRSVSHHVWTVSECVNDVTQWAWEASVDSVLSAVSRRGSVNHRLWLKTALHERFLKTTSVVFWRSVKKTDWTKLTPLLDLWTSLRRFVCDADSPSLCLLTTISTEGNQRCHLTAN